MWLLLHFGGRIPALMAERLKCTAGKGAAAVTAAVYGNRAYEDALVELNDALEEQGFEPFASVAVLAEHSSGSGGGGRTSGCEGS